jgi:cysteine desulfurase/selenocysteine lyase
MEAAEYLPPPQRFEAGTQRVSQAIALAAAVDYLDALGMGRIAAHEAALGRRLRAGLEEIEGVRVLGPSDAHAVGLAAIETPGIHAHDLGQYLDAQGIAARVGHHCAQPLHRRLGLTASTRASSYLYTTPDEVDAYLAALPSALSYFGGMR